MAGALYLPVEEKAGAAEARAGRRRTLAVPGVTALLWLLFAALAWAVAAGRTLAVDRRLRDDLHAHASPLFNQALRPGTGFAYATIAALPLLLLWLCWRRRWWTALASAGSVVAVYLLYVVVKNLVQRTPPGPFGGPEEHTLDHLTPPGQFGLLATASNYSFPSGHVVIALVVYGLIAYFVGRRLALWARVALGAGALLIAAWVAFSRVYYGMHYPADVLGALLLGGAWLCLVLPALGRLDSRVAGLA
jgi:undecaprenyl-diphosphatase